MKQPTIPSDDLNFFRGIRNVIILYAIIALVAIIVRWARL